MDSYTDEGPTEDQVINWAEHNAHTDGADPEPDEAWLQARGALADSWDGTPAEVAIRRLRDGWDVDEPQQPRVFFLGGRQSQEIPREHWERRRESYDGPRYREAAVEIAPGVFVVSLGHGGFILPGTREVDGRTYPNTAEGVQIAVWTERSI